MNTEPNQEPPINRAQLAHLVRLCIDAHSTEELALGFLRYEALRRVTTRAFGEMVRRALAGECFDDIVTESLLKWKTPSEPRRRKRGPEPQSVGLDMTKVKAALLRIEDKSAEGQRKEADRLRRLEAFCREVAENPDGQKKAPSAWSGHISAIPIPKKSPTESALRLCGQGQRIMMKNRIPRENE